MEHCNKVSCNDTRRRPVGSGRLSTVWESNSSLLDWQTSDRSPGDMGCVPLKKGQEECVVQRILHRLERRPCVQGDSLHEIPLLLKGLLQAHVGGLRVLSRQPTHNGHQNLPSLHLIPQLPSLLLLRTNKPP